MKVLMLVEWDIPKDEARLKMYGELIDDTSLAERMKDIKYKHLGSWTHNTARAQLEASPWDTHSRK